MKNPIGLLAALFVLFLMASPAASATARYRVGIAYANSLMSKSEVFEFRLGTKRLQIDHDHPQGWFEGDFATGERFTVTQTSGPRTCALSDERLQPIADHDVQLLANCGVPPLAIGKLQITGVVQGETFSFADDYNRRYTIPFSTTMNIGGFPVGDDFAFRQISGPRTCSFSGFMPKVPATAFTIVASCGAGANPGPVPSPTPDPAPNPSPKPAVAGFELVSRSADGKSTGTFYSATAPVIGGTGADDGRYVAFVSDAAGLGGSLGKYRQIIWRDRLANVTKVISVGDGGVEGNGNSFAPSMSADGKTVAFESYAKNLDSRDPNAGRDVYVWRESTGRAELVSVGPRGVGDYESYEPSVSGDGSVVAFTSYASNFSPLAPGQSSCNVFVKDIAGGAPTLVSIDEKTKKGGGGSAPSVSFDGSRIAFYNYFPLTSEDKNGLWDIYVWERGNPKLRRVSRTASGGERDQGDESASRVVWPMISGDGRFVTFSTTAANMGGSPGNKKQQVYVAQVDGGGGGGGGGVKRMSVGADGAEGDADSPISQGERVWISQDGTWVAFATAAKNLGGKIVMRGVTNGERMVILAPLASDAGRPAMSPSGRYVVFGTNQRLDPKFSSSGLFVNVQ